MHHSYAKGHKLLEVHGVVKWVTLYVVHYELGHYEPSRLLVVNDMGVESCGEYVIQPSADRVRWGSRHQYVRLLLLW